MNHGRMILYLICLSLRIEAVCMIPRPLLISVYQTRAALCVGPLSRHSSLCPPSSTTRRWKPDHWRCRGFLCVSCGRRFRSTCH